MEDQTVAIFQEKYFMFLFCQYLSEAFHWQMPMYLNLQSLDYEGEYNHFFCYSKLTQI
jgi:hypothetical protein